VIDPSFARQTVLQGPVLATMLKLARPAILFAGSGCCARAVSGQVAAVLSSFQDQKLLCNRFSQMADIAQTAMTLVRAVGIERTLLLGTAF
jgi:hypothetical protein